MNGVGGWALHIGGNRVVKNKNIVTGRGGKWNNQGSGITKEENLHKMGGTTVWG